VRAEVECEIKYRGYIDRQLREIARAHESEGVSLPDTLDYTSIPSLSSEVKEKLEAVRPSTLGQAARIPGITPAAISILAVHVRRHLSETSAAAEPRSA
jgi:tRNA uridine 5-carboxymethylaminomethyl modification enzyme